VDARRMARYLVTGLLFVSSSPARIRQLRHRGPLVRGAQPAPLLSPTELIGPHVSKYDQQHS
jgi:hypothetical protein